MYASNITVLNLDCLAASDTGLKRDLKTFCHQEKRLKGSSKERQQDKVYCQMSPLR